MSSRVLAKGRHVRRLHVPIQQAAFQIRLHVSIFYRAVQVMQLAWIRRQIVEFAHAGGPMDQFVGRRAQHHVAADAVGVLLLQAALGVVDMFLAARELIPGGTSLKAVRLMNSIAPFEEDCSIRVAGRAVQLGRQ